MPDPEPDQYEGFADAYRAHAELAPYNALYDRPATLDLLGPVEGLEVLDAGCGPGIYAEALLARGARVIGCDASARMVELARERVGGAADLRQHDLDQPMNWQPDASVDVVLCALAYHYVTLRASFLADVHRMLRPAGRLIISTSHPTSDWLRLGGSYFASEAVTETWSQGWQVTAWRVPLTQLCEEFADAGFWIERLVEPRPAPAMEQAFPKQFAKLQTRPGFVCFRLAKR